ncbi:MAG TPA: metal-dependent hydrolase [Candidatus Paceibacterota bacterium]|jgi:hypothetical protein|nr:metal-dependent hydrolase [Candidatus Paceibacterota bacterium]
MEPVVNERERRHAQELMARHVPIPNVWYKRNIFFTLFMNAGSVGIPDAERFVVSAVEAFAESGDYPTLRELIIHIIVEEKAHARVHDAYNEYLRSTGLSFDRYIRQSTRFLDFVSRRFSIKSRLAFACTIEHFTATGARQILDYAIFEGEDVDERMDRVWTWHALEELDHRSTVFDLYLAAGGGYFRRVSVAFFATAVFIYFQHPCFLSFLRQRGVLWNGRVWRNGLPYLFGKKGVYRRMFFDWLKLFRPGFHPTDIPIRNVLQKQLHHYHMEDELIKYFQIGTLRASL